MDEQNVKYFSYRSDQIDQIATALAKAQNEFTIAYKNKKNPFFKSQYADFTAVVLASRPALTKYGLAVVQPPVVIDDNGTMILLTDLIHSSGQYIQSQMKISPAKQDAQELSKYITYLKRVAYASLVGVLTGDEEDDDGESDRRAREEYPTPRQEVATIRADQIEKLETDLSGWPQLAQQIKNRLKIDKLEDMPLDKFYACIDWIKKNKDAEGK